MGPRGQLAQLRASKNEFAEGHSRGPRTAGLDLLCLEPVVLILPAQPFFYCSLLSRLSLVRDMSWSRPEISRSIFFQVRRGFPVVRDYWSGKRRDPIATANSVKSIVESSWFLKKVDVSYAGSRINFSTTFPNSKIRKWVQWRPYPENLLCFSSNLSNLVGKVFLDRRSWPQL